MKVVIKTTKVVRETAFERRMREMNERMERQQAEMQARLDRVFGVEQRIVETEEIVEVPTTIDDLFFPRPKVVVVRERPEVVVIRREPSAEQVLGGLLVDLGAAIGGEIMRSRRKKS